jgi:uncharacterized protein YdaU (DUF1376 family)
MKSNPRVIHSYPWYIQEWLLSDARARLTLEERGLYREVIDLMYADGGSLPDDPLLIQRKAACGDKEFKKAWPRVRQCFMAEAGRIYQDKVSSTLARLQDYHDTRKEAGKSGARKRWEQSDSSPDSSAMAEPSPSYSSANGSAKKPRWQNDSLNRNNHETKRNETPPPERAQPAARETVDVGSDSAAPPAEIVANLCEQYFFSERGKPDGRIVQSIVKALGGGSEPQLIAFRDYLQAKQDSKFLPKSWGIFPLWAQEVAQNGQQ